MNSNECSYVHRQRYVDEDATHAMVLSMHTYADRLKMKTEGDRMMTEDEILRKGIS